MKKVFILYNRKDRKAVEKTEKFLSSLKELSSDITPITINIFYHRILKLISQSDLILLIWSANSLKSKWFKILANNIIRRKIECYSVFHDITEDDFEPEDSFFLSIPKFYEVFKDFKLEDICPQMSDIDDQFFFESGDDRTIIMPSHKNRSSRDVANFAVFSPHKIRIGSGFIIDIWAYLEDQYDMVLKKSEKIKRDKIIGSQDSIAIERESLLTVMLEMDTLNVETKFNYLYWEGKPASTSFAIYVPKDAIIGVHFGTAKISFNGISIANLIFNVNVSESKSDLNYQDTKAKINKYKSAFASYSSKDSAEVFGRVHGMTKIAPDLNIFTARYYLKSKERWKEALLEHLPNKDVFYLFWSRNALNSTWVDREWRIALKERDLSYIDPVPLESPRLAPPPPELSALHFDDIWVALKHENDYIDSQSKYLFYSKPFSK